MADWAYKSRLPAINKAIKRLFFIPFFISVDDQGYFLQMDEIHHQNHHHLCSALRFRHDRGLAACNHDYLDEAHSG
jgi:hypothetical protein